MQDCKSTDVNKHGFILFVRFKNILDSITLYCSMYINIDIIYYHKAYPLLSTFKSRNSCA